MNKLGTKLGAIAMSAAMALTFAPSTLFTLAAGSESTPAASELSVPVYRLYNPNNGEHLFTQDAKECEWLQTVGWTYERVAWYAPTEGEMVYRLNNPNHPLGDHLYTSNPNEVSDLLGLGWTQDETFFYAASADDLLASPVYRLYNPNAYDQGLATHHWTLDSGEIGGLTTAGWNDEGTKFYEYEEDIDPVGTISVEIDNDTPKVGDTLTATVKGMAAAKYEWAVSADGEDWSVVETETDETFAVTADLVGMYVKVTVTAEDGETASDVTLSQVEEADNEIEITSATATAANTILITFAEAVPFDTEITVQKSTLTTTTTGTVTFDEDYKGATFVASANFTNGTYVVTAESDDSSDTAEVEITTQKVDDIVITSTTALTGPADPNDGLKKDAYVYYKVFDQYGEDITENTSVEVNGSYTIQHVDRNTGCITIRNAQGFRYNDLVTVSIVHAQSGTVATKSLNVGLEQYIDTIAVAGFLSLSEPTKLQSTIPAGFNKDEWLVLFKGYDQDGNEMNVDNYDFATDVTVTTTATLLIGTNSFKKGSTLAAKGGADHYTIDGTDYSAFTIQPGMYVDKGGEATLNIISNKTGTQSFETVKIGAQDVLQALVLNDPGTVTDGDTVTIPYTATTTTGESTTDFETIVRSTNALTLTASVGVLSVREDNNGKAVVKWADAIPTGTNYLDNVDRPVTFTTVVVGGDANTSTIYVSDFAYPVAATVTKLPQYIVQGKETTAKITLGKKGDAVYVDQYGRTLDAPDAEDRLLAIAQNGNTNMDFAIAVDKTAGSSIKANLSNMNDGGAITVGGTEKEYFVVQPASVDLGDLTITTFDATNGTPLIYTDDKYAQAPASNTLKLSIETKKSAGTTLTDYAAAGKKLTATITTIGLDKLSNFAIKPISGLVPVTTAASAYGNLREAIDGMAVANTDGVLTIAGVSAKSVTVTGGYNGTAITVPAEFYTGIDDGSSQIVVNAASKLDIAAATATAANISVNKLYSTTEYTRKTATLPVAVNVYTMDTTTSTTGTLDKVNVNKVSTTVDVQDGNPYAATIKFYDSGANEITDGVFNADELKYTIDGTTWNLRRITGASAADFIQANPWRNVYYAVYDQYGDRIDVANETFKITDIKESTGPLTHVTLNGFSVTANQTASVDVDYAEIGDTFNLTVSNGGASATIAITQGSDDEALITNFNDLDKPFRKNFLGYDR